MNWPCEQHLVPNSFLHGYLFVALSLGLNEVLFHNLGSLVLVDIGSLSITTFLVI